MNNHCHFCGTPCASDFEACPPHKQQVINEYTALVRQLTEAKAKKAFEERFKNKYHAMANHFDYSGLKFARKNPRKVSK